MIRIKESLDNNQKRYITSTDIYADRNNLYNRLLRNYIADQRMRLSRKQKYRCIFFAITMFLFMIIVVSGSACIVLSAKKINTSIADIGVALSGVSSILGVVIVLPNKIASYLFPPQEDQEVLNLIKQLQKSDEEHDPTCDNNCPMFDEKNFK